MSSAAEQGLLPLPMQEADAYLDRVCAMIRSARLNEHYPEARSMIAHLESMHSRVMRGLYNGVNVELESGLPTYKDWARVRTDASLVDEVLINVGSLPQLEARAAQESEGGIYAKQLIKYHYYSDLKERTLVPLDAMDVRLRRTEPESGQAFFHIIFDKLDSKGLFVRYTIDLAQRSSFWKRAMIQLNEDHAQHASELRSMVYRFASLDAEFTFVNLSANPNITVERVFKSTVGPFFMKELPQDDPRMGLLQGDAAAIGSFAFDMASTDIAADADNDPFEDLMSAKLSEEARADYEAARTEMGYMVFKDRKFVADAQSMSALQAYCQNAGTKNIIYPLRARRRRRRRSS